VVTLADVVLFARMGVCDDDHVVLCDTHERAVTVSQIVPLTVAEP
jgi:hypothetical protein